MKHLSLFRSGFLASILIALTTACATERDTVATNDAVIEKLASNPDLAALFDAASLAKPIKTVDCTLSGGTETQCLSITLNSAPANIEIGPWCPRNISDGPDVSGIWLDGGNVYDADGQFIQSLDTFYADSRWSMFDPDTGKINVTDSKVSCEAAARPDVDPSYQNHCVECQISYMEPTQTQTYLIPVVPTVAARATTRIERSGVGVAFSGVRMDGPAPTDAILAAHTLAPFDDCGGHVNLHVGYHLHAVTDEPCLQERLSIPDHAPIIGLAMDGFAIHRREKDSLSETEDLDICGGHDVAGAGYHYHVNAPGANAILTCLKGETGCAQGDEDAVCDASASAWPGPQGMRPPPPGGQPPRPQD